MLKQKLQEELKKSMLARDELKTSVLRLLLSAINYFEIQKVTELAERASSPASEADRCGRYEATDDDVIKVIQKEVKQRRESIEQFKAGGRQELVDKETKELKILQTYLPEQMSKEEIRKLVDQAISQTGATSISEIGKVMGVLMPKVKGRTDGTTVSRLIKEALSSSS